jgi:hypothetical protein
VYQSPCPCQDLTEGLSVPVKQSTERSTVLLEYATAYIIISPGYEKLIRLNHLVSSCLALAHPTTIGNILACLSTRKWQPRGLRTFFKLCLAQRSLLASRKVWASPGVGPLRNKDGPQGVVSQPLYQHTPTKGMFWKSA